MVTAPEFREYSEILGTIPDEKGLPRDDEMTLSCDPVIMSLREPAYAERALRMER